MTPLELKIREVSRALAWNLKEWRTFRQATVEKLAEMAELSPRIIQRIEAGRVRPRLDTIASLAFGLGIDIRDLLAPMKR